MTLTLDSLPQPDSCLSRLDPRWKLAGLTLATLCVALLQSLTATLLAMVGALVLVALAGLPRRWYVSRLGGIALFFLAFVVLLPFLLDDGGRGAIQLDTLEVAREAIAERSALRRVPEFDTITGRIDDVQEHDAYVRRHQDVDGIFAGRGDGGAQVARA